MSFSESELTGKDIAETLSSSFSNVGPSGNISESPPGVVCVVFKRLLRSRHMEVNETLFALFSEIRQTCNNNVIEFSSRSLV